MSNELACDSGGKLEFRNPSHNSSQAQINHFILYLGQWKQGGRQSPGEYPNLLEGEGHPSEESVDGKRGGWETGWGEQERWKFAEVKGEFQEGKCVCSWKCVATEGC